MQGKTGSRTICKTCKVEIQGLVNRMKAHYEWCQKRKTELDDLSVATGKQTKILFLII